MRIILIATLLGIMSCGTAQESTPLVKEKPSDLALDSLSTAYFASGCFWCVEAIFEQVEGVAESVSGYSGGHTDDPTYRKIGTGTTGHTESVKIYYDPSIVSYETLLTVYYDSQDPTTIGQSPDFGDQYRSVIFYENEAEKQAAETYKRTLGSSGTYAKPIATEILAFEKFYDAEDYHQDYEQKNPNDRYVTGVSIPRLNRFKAKHPDLIKANH